MTMLIFLVVACIFAASFYVPWLKRLRHRIEDQSLTVHYPLHLTRGDAVTLDGCYRVAQSDGVLKTHADLVAWVMEAPKDGVPTRQERGWVRDI